jgi:predicted metallopeptidase
VDAVGTNEYISTVARAVFCVYNHTIFTVFHTLDALVGLHPVFVLEAIVEDFENRLTIEEDLGIPNSEITLVPFVRIG